MTTDRRQALLLLLFVLVAAYLPSFLWIPIVPEHVGLNNAFLFSVSPVIIVFDIYYSLLVAYVALGLYIFFLVVLSLTLYKSRIARIVLPCAVFALSLAQGLNFIWAWDP
jgi:hypothetical protein